MRLWQWLPVCMWMWLAELETGEAAPRGDGTRASGLGASPRLVVDRPDFFDYPDSDQASLLAVAQFIGEKPVTFVRTDSGSKLFQHILVGALVVGFFFLLFQFFTHVSFQKGA
ncbi:fertilization-influencing membrane protein [Meriones unguiculatus]|uniref:fertilization-influencing membrane protein n=1 Tax=Meriones unguiculatus TaxID=10047 RepID=UPI000B4ED2E7|nr:fertilization-influencing membrane protein [Meriones unguiculatus]